MYLCQFLADLMVFLPILSKFKRIFAIFCEFMLIGPDLHMFFYIYEYRYTPFGFKYNKAEYS